MAFRFRKSFKIAHGVRINLSKSGFSTTIGGKGASVNIGGNGTYLNTSIPGTGLYSREKISSGSTSQASEVPNPNNSNKDPFPVLPLIGWGITSYILASISQIASGLVIIVAVVLAVKGLINLIKKKKPVYSSQSVYKNDRRFKTGQRHIGYKKVKSGSVLMLPSEKRDRMILGGIELLYAAYLAYKAYPFLK